MPAAMPVRVAASMIVFTSLLSDIVILKIIFFQFNSKPCTNEFHARHHHKFSWHFSNMASSGKVERICQENLKGSIVKSAQIINIPLTAATVMKTSVNFCMVYQYG